MFNNNSLLIRKIVSKCQLGIEQESIEAMFNITSLYKPLTHFIDYDSTGMLELPYERTPWIKISDTVA